MNPNDSQRNERHRDDRRYVFNNRTNSRYSRNADLIQAARVGPVNEDVVEPMQIELALYQSSSAPSDPPIDAFQMAYRPMTSSAGDPTNQFNLSAWDGVPSPHAQPNYSHPHLGLFSTPPAPAYSSATAHTSPPVYSSTEGSNFPTRFLSINLPYPHVNHPQGYLPNGMEWSSNVVQPNYGPIRETIHDGQDAYHGQDAHAGQNAHHGQDAHDEKDTHDEHDKHDEHDEDDSYDQYAAWDGRSFDTAFTSPREFKKIVRGYILDLSHKKQDKALIWGRRVEDIRQVLLDTKSTKVESAQFRFWAKKMFKLEHLDGPDRLPSVTHEGRPVAAREQLYHVLCKAHGECLHGGRDKTSAKVRERVSWVPKELIARFVQHCPTCRARRSPRASRSLSPDNHPLEYYTKKWGMNGQEARQGQSHL